MVSTIRRTLLACLQVYKQWGVTGNNNVLFPVTFSQSCYIVNCNGSDWGSSGGATSAGISIQNITLQSFAVYTWEREPFRWLALGKQQWGNAGNGGGSVDVTFPISFTKTVYQIQLTCNSDSYENPVYAIKDTKSFSYWSKYGGDKLWFALGMQQWGVVTSYDVTVNFPVAYSTQIFCLTAFHSASDTSTLDLYAEHVMLNGFNFAVAAPDNAYKSFERGYWLSIGV